MTHKLKKWCLLTIAVIILPIAANADDSGSCGKNVTYYFDEKTHTLTISGEGPMETNPWIKNSKDIEIIIINEGVTSICDMAFYGCSNITSVNVPNSIKDIYFSAFSGCSKLSSFTIPSSVRNLCDGVFSDCTKLKTLIVEEGEEPLNLVLRSLTLGCFSNAIEEIFLGRDMYVERDEWNQQYKPFKESQSLRKLSIGKNYTKIPTDYFYGCTNLTSVTFLDGLLEIGDNSFVNCTNISSLSFPSSLKIIGTNAFVGCEKIEEIVIPGNVSTIYPWAFSCSNLRTVTIEEGDESLKFEGNKSIAFVGPIEKINLRRNVECYFSPFSPSTSLNLTIGNKVTTLGGGIFAELTNGIGNLEFEDGEDILISQNFKAGFGVNMNPFSKTPINDVYMGRSIEGSLLAGVTSPFTLIFGTNISEIAENSYSYLNISSLSIPKNIKKIGSSAFMDCQYLSIITIEDGSESISINNNFLNSPLKELYVGRNFDYPDGFSPFSFLESLTLLKIGGQVTSLGDQAFSGCPNLKDVFSFALKTPSTGQNVFTDSYLSEATLHIIASAYKEYKSLAPWNKFKQIVASDGGTILYTLTYLVDGEVYKSYDLEEGASITPEGTPTKEGYTFSGWSEIPETMPANDVTITGTFTANKYKLTYMVDNAEYKSYDVEYGAAITPEAEPTKEGYTFSGWSSIPETMPAKDVTVTGTFTKGAYKLTYMVDGEVYKTITYDYGATITPEAEPTKEGYTFSGWSNIPETMPANDVTVYGTFTVNKYKLTYIIDGQTYKEYEIEYGASITPEPDPTLEGYTFSGWSEIPETMPAHDVEITGSFTQNVKADPDLAINGKGTFIAELGFIVTLGQPYEFPELFNPYGLSPIEWTSSNPDVATVDANGILTLLSVGQTQIKATFAGNNEYEAGMAEYSLVVIDSGYMMDDNGNVTAIGGDQTGDVTIEATITINGQTYQVTAIASYAFKDNQNITSLTIPAGITTIGDNAFNGCINLIVINIGKDVQSIGNKAFANVGTATVRTRSEDASLIVNCYAESVPQAAWDTFENTTIESGILYVEDDLKDSYKATSPWNKFGKILGFNEPVGINSISIESNNAIIFDMQGNRLDNVRKGVNIIHTKNGKTKKMIRK